MHPFEEYLRRKNMQPYKLSQVSGVRYVTVYNATKGVPISAENAQKIRRGVWEITGEVYRGQLAVISPKAIEDMPTIPIKKIPRQ